jgi:hypothetical protein
MKSIIAGALLFVAAFPASAAVTQILTPDADYIADTSLLPITTGEFELFSSLTDGNVTATLSPSVGTRIVGSSWATWGSPPDTEGAFPTIGATEGATSLTFSFDKTLRIFGAEFEPNPFALIPFTAEFFLGGVSQGTISRDIEGNAGARILAASGVFDEVVVTADADFAFAQLRVAVVPEPATWGMLILGFGLVGATLRRRTAVEA